MNKMITNGSRAGRVGQRNEDSQTSPQTNAAVSHTKLVSQAGSGLRKWDEYESMLREDKKRTFKQLKRATGSYRKAIVECNEPNIAVPLLLSMVIELKSQLEVVEDEVEILRIKENLDSVTETEGGFKSRSVSGEERQRQREATLS